MKVEVRDLARDEILLARFVESDGRISIAVLVDGKDRVIITVTPETIGSYMRDLTRERADIQTIRARFGIHNKMKV